MSDALGGAPHGGGAPISGDGQAEEPGQEQPALEDRQPSADQDDVLAIDGRTDQEAVLGADEQTGEDGVLGADERAGEDGVLGAGRQTDQDGLATDEQAERLSALDIENLPEPDPQVVRTVEALLFLAPDPLSPQELSDAAATEELEVIAALAELAGRYAPG
ncbi:MAG TPA: hypothetical protein VK781_12690, partial [Solirubrobacteraceae bacterium]|nr:hypothetical protein [Solirubrobacteraceae bacterium]